MNRTSGPAIRHAPLVLASVVGCLAAAFLAIWLVAPGLKEFSSRMMKANTALGLILASVAVGLSTTDAHGERKTARYGRWFAVAAFLVGALTAIEYVFDWDLGIDELFVVDALTEESRRFPGRMSPIAATCFGLLGLGIAFVDVSSPRTRAHLASALALPVIVVSLIAMAGYFYDVRDFYQVGPYLRIAWATAISFLFLGIATLLLRPERGPIRYFANPRLSGVMSRRLLPVVVVLPLAIGWLRLWAQRSGIIGLELGVALFAVTLALVLATTIWINARALDDIDRLREQTEGLFRSFFNLGLVGMAQGDPRTGRILRVNSKLEEITGYSAAELEQTTIADITHPDDRDRDSIGLSRIADDTATTYSTETRYIAKDGRLVWAIMNAAAAHEASTGRVSVVAVIQDITPLKEAQENLAQALRLREQFLGIASHELKTPLTSLLMQIQALQRTLGNDPSVAKYEARLGKAASSALRLDKLINELLDVSRLVEGRLKLEPERFDLGELTEEVLRRFTDPVPSSQSLITFRGEPDVVGTWDRARIDQVLTNLLTNALKYGAGRPIEVSLRKEEMFAAITVRDQGIGIPSNMLDHIFERFARAVDERSYSGFGLGLWIARDILAASGGTIDVESVEGEGTSFTVRLPLEKEDRR